MNPTPQQASELAARDAAVMNALRDLLLISRTLDPKTSDWDRRTSIRYAFNLLASSETEGANDKALAAQHLNQVLKEEGIQIPQESL